jgi:hypothetical protein
MPDPTMDSLEAQIARHWREHRPKMSRELEEAGMFRQSVKRAADRYTDVLVQCVQKGLDPNQAEELAREEWMYPSEEDMPVLGERPPDPTEG